MGELLAVLNSPIPVILIVGLFWVDVRGHIRNIREQQVLRDAHADKQWKLIKVTLGVKEEV